MIRIYSFEDSTKERRQARILAAVRAYTEQLGMPFRDAEDWRIDKTDRGKPFFAFHPEISISITDSDGHWMMAFSDGKIGIDLQRRRVRGDRERLAKRFFHLAEAAWILEAADEASATERFFRIWTAKEAYVKYTGQGIDNGFSEFSVLPESDQVMAEAGMRSALGAKFLYLPVIDGCEFCICVPEGASPEGRICFMETDPREGAGFGMKEICAFTAEGAAH